MNRRLDRMVDRAFLTGAALALLMGTGLGYTLSHQLLAPRIAPVEPMAPEATLSGAPPKAAPSSAPASHDHAPISVPAGIPAPALSLRLTPDAVSGFNLSMTLERYRLTPPPPGVMDMAQLMVPAVSRAGWVEGHAHLYVNGVKVGRIYGRDIHLPGTLMRPGVNQVTVTLNSHGHQAWTVEGRPVLATLFIRGGEVTHRFESFPARPELAASSPRPALEGLGVE